MEEKNRTYKGQYSHLIPRVLSVYAWADGHVSLNVFPEKMDIDKIPAYVVLNNASRKALIKLLGGKI
jgi:hypothetical protein